MKKTIWNENIFRKNDIRGVYKKDFDLRFVKILAEAFARLSSEKLSLALGYDARLSSREIAEHLSKSLIQTGADVYWLGLLPSPACFFASYFMKHINSSIMVTASHNPPHFNGFKMILNKETICENKILELKKIAQAESSHSFSSSSSKGKLIRFDIKPFYVAFHQKHFSLSSGAQAPHKKNLLKKSLKKIAIDCGNGASGPLAKKTFKALKLPLKIHWLYTKPDGHFPFHLPDPSSAKNLKSLKKTVKEKNCDFGVAFDGDGDRLVILGKSGKILAGDELMSIFISDILKRAKQKKSSLKKIPTIVADVKCGDCFFNFLKKQKIKSIMWKSGHSLIREKTLKEKAIFGGELSGHFFFQDDFFPLDDGIYALLRLINICAREGKGPEDLVLKKKSIESPEIRKAFSNTAQAKKKLRRLKSFYQNQNKANCFFIDGVRVSFPGKAWGLARLSNTQSEWTFRFGGLGQKELEKIKKDFYRLLF